MKEWFRLVLMLVVLNLLGFSGGWLAWGELMKNGLPWVLIINVWGFSTIFVAWLVWLALHHQMVRTPQVQSIYWEEKMVSLFLVVQVLVASCIGLFVHRHLGAAIFMVPPWLLVNLLVAWVLSDD